MPCSKGLARIHGTSFIMHDRDFPPGVGHLWNGVGYMANHHIRLFPKALCLLEGAPQTVFSGRITILRCIYLLIVEPYVTVEFIPAPKSVFLWKPNLL